MAKLCNNCAQELPDSAAVCNFCGTQLFAGGYAAPAQQQPQQQYYPPQQQYNAQQPQYQQPQYPVQQPQYPQYQQPAYPPDVQQPYAQQPQYQYPQYPAQQPQQHAPSQPYYAQAAPAKPKKAGKTFFVFALIIVLLAGAGTAVYFLFFNTANSPEGVATAWVDSMLDGDIDKLIKHTALGDEMIDLTVRQGFASSRNDALKYLNDDIIGDMGGALLSFGASLLDIKLEVSSSTELSESRRNNVLGDIRYMANTGDAIFDNAVISLCDSITTIHQVGIGVSVLGFGLPTEQFISLYIAQIDGKWLVLPTFF